MAVPRPIFRPVSCLRAIQPENSRDFDFLHLLKWPVQFQLLPECVECGTELRDKAVAGLSLGTFASALANKIPPRYTSTCSDQDCYDDGQHGQVGAQVRSSMSQ
eukprot:366520-Chlamydomonas_euryale.AAC.1